MKKLKARLAALLEKLGANKARLRFTYRRWKYHNAKAQHNHNRRIRYQKKADRARESGHPKHARKMDRTANRSERKRVRHAAKRAEMVTEIKRLKRAILHLESSIEDRQAELEKLKKKHKITVRGDKVSGGSKKQRFIFTALKSAANCASGKRRNFYSQPGRWTVDECLTGEEYGERSDCSQWLTSVCKSADLPDPNGTNWTGGYTGTLVQQNNGWKYVGEAKMKEAGFGFVIYGGGTGHHVEAYVGPGDRTIGHGSAPIDAGVINLFNDGNYFCYTLVN